MSFGPRMRLQIGDLTIELAPHEKEAMSEFINPGMQQLSVTRYLSMGSAPVLEDELEWFEKVRTDKARINWGIWVVDGDTRQLIGDSSLFDIKRSHTLQAESGSVIANKEFWGKGIATAIHKARTWYAFEQMGLTRISSRVIQGNTASKKALLHSGYSFTHMTRNVEFSDGQLRHMDSFECINPSELTWRLWWGSDRPTSAAREAREQTRQALEWARQNVTLL